MKIFKINETAHIECTTLKRKNGFAHKATLYENLKPVTSVSVSYLNRTWESFQYETVLTRLLEKTKIVPEEKMQSVLKDWGKHDMDELKALSRIAKLGNILGKTMEEKNSWKKRMLSTNPLISFPDDFDCLPEEEKQKRLDGALSVFDKNK